MMLLFSLLFACRTTAPAPTPAVDAAEVWKTHVTHTLGDGGACTIVAMHGFGATPESLQRVYQGLPLRAVVVLPRAPHPKGRGSAWFFGRDNGDIRAAGDRLAGAMHAGIPGAKPGAKVIVTGFSQGGMLSWALATGHPDLVDAAFPIGGILPGPWPTTANDTPIHVFHGEADTVVSFEEDAKAAKAMQTAGWPVEMHSYPGVPHTIPPSMRRDLATELTKLCN